MSINFHCCKKTKIQLKFVLSRGANISLAPCEIIEGRIQEREFVSSET